MSSAGPAYEIRFRDDEVSYVVNVDPYDSTVVEHFRYSMFKSST
jgi:hypothetical protein